MDVHLLIYDLSAGLARQIAGPMFGLSLDAVYHTSIELGGYEYVYDRVIMAIPPRSSHLGQPIERLLLGRTELPADLIQEYLDSVRPVFTPDAYNLFSHNCNNFTDCLAWFLVGRGIPQHILDMPRRVADALMAGPAAPSIATGPPSGAQLPGFVGHGPVPARLAPPALSAPHPHLNLRLPILKGPDVKMVVFANRPPLDEIPAETDETSSPSKPLQDLKVYIEASERIRGTGFAELPDLDKLDDLIRTSVPSIPQERLLKLLSMLRYSLVDPRISLHFTRDPSDSSTIAAVLELGGEGKEHLLQLSILEIACNLFSTPIFVQGSHTAHPGLRSQLIELIVSGILDETHEAIRVRAACLLFNLGLADLRERESQPVESALNHLLMDDDERTELAASTVEAIRREAASAETLRRLLAGLGQLVYLGSGGGALAELLETLEAKEAVRESGEKMEGMQELAAEVLLVLESVGAVI